jgi:hypothetical protein
MDKVVMLFAIGAGMILAFSPAIYAGVALT